MRLDSLYMGFKPNLPLTCCRCNGSTLPWEKLLLILYYLSNTTFMVIGAPHIQIKSEIVRQSRENKVLFAPTILPDENEFLKAESAHQKTVLHLHMVCVWDSKSEVSFLTDEESSKAAGIDSITHQSEVMGIKYTVAGYSLLLAYSSVIVSFVTIA
ncbi:unnamed protein product [Allacma fusca]|uniref:Uncharacterized protein n=1 Tax=Allacma fusca TaxID=39272 RepID=A0A8J2KAK8_9HEXA|nr:unnamed protein product [Allacma fusca]